MDERQKAEFKRLAGNGIRFDCPMKDRTTLHVGGPVEALWDVNDLEVLKAGMAYLFQEKIPRVPLGRGSNLLVTDEGLSGVMIRLTGPFAKIDRAYGKISCCAGAGIHISELLNWCRKKGLAGLEFLAGIPASLGGAVAMNAGAFGAEIKDRIASVQMVTPEGGFADIERADLHFSYRRLHLKPGSIVTGACFFLETEPENAISERIRRYLGIRKSRQPQDLPSAGSIFRNPSGAYAGKMIEEANLKGRAVGGAMVSSKHANWIVNTGNARAEDILALMDRVRSEVQRTTGLLLEPEIQILGKTPRFADNDG